MPKISVIIPAYNVEAYISQCIESVMDQTIQDIEIIIINDGSTDNTGKLCKKYAEDDKRVIYIETPNQGVAAARNMGIEKALSEWLCFVDGDDYLPENSLEILLVNAGDSDMVIGNYYLDKYGRVHREKFFSEEIRNQEKHDKTYLIGNALGSVRHGAKGCTNIGVPWGRLYRSETISKWGGYSRR